MITVYFKNEDKKEEKVTPSGLKKLNKEDILWIDLDNPTLEERKGVERYIGVKLLTREQAEEIESTSKYSESSDAIIANCNYFISRGNAYQIEPTTFILTNEGFLVSDHQVHPASFHEVEKRIALFPKANGEGTDVFMTMLEALIDYDADMVEQISHQISTLAKDLNSSENIDKAVLHRINNLQEKTMAMRENIFDLQRVISAIMRSNRFPKEVSPRLSMMLKDVDSLISHGDFGFERLDYLQDNALGLINIEQNEIVKILSVAAVIFMPPTLIASIYGMNFKVMPELDWTWTAPNGWIVPAGYFFAIFLMLLVTFFTYWFFRYKKWL